MGSNEVVAQDVLKIAGATSRQSGKARQQNLGFPLSRWRHQVFQDVPGG
jgi:hypothetical protein